jgi:hypothetical protein
MEGEVQVRKLSGGRGQARGWCLKLTASLLLENKAFHHRYAMYRLVLFTLRRNTIVNF